MALYTDTKETIQRVTELQVPTVWRPTSGPGLSSRVNQSQTNLVKKAIETATTVSETATGGIPLQILTVTAVESPSKQQDRTYSEVSVSFTRNTSDANFASVKVWFIGYQGSATPTLVCEGATSPITFLVETTGETVTVKAQAVGSTGLTADFDSAPSTTVVLDGVVSAPPAPNVSQSLVGTPTGYQFQFDYEAGLLADVIQSYNIYRFTSNTPGSATIVKNVPQPSTNTGKYTYQETVPNGQTYFYWVTSVNTVGLESTKTAAQSGAVTNGSLLNSSGQIINNQVYNNVGVNGASAWFKVGTWVFSGAPASLGLEFIAGQGYNSNTNQQSIANITIRSSNDTAAPNLSGITWQENGGSQGILAIKAAATGGSTSASNHSWDIYVQFANFAIGTLIVKVSSADTWTQINSSSSDPGAASSTVVVGSGGLVGNVGGSGLNGVNDGSSKFAATASTLTYRPTTNPLTASDAGSNATISIASFTQRTSSKGDISVNSGSITALSYSTLYYVYYDDATLAGGAVTYAATTTKTTAINGSGRFFVGSIITPAATAPDTTGNNDGGVGAQSGQTSVFLFGAITTTTSGVDAANGNLSNCIDGNLTTFGFVKINTAGSANASSTATLSGASPTSAPWTSLTLNVRSQVPTNNVTPGTSPASISYSTDGGSSFTTIWSVGAVTTRSLQTDSVALPVGLNLANLRVQATVFRGSGSAQSVQLNVYEAWVVGLQ